MVSTKALKGIATGVIFGLTVLASFLPYKIRAQKRILSILSVLSSGVFLGAALCHLLADSADQFNEYFEDDHHHHDDEAKLRHGGGDGDEPFPWAFCLAGCGFICTLMVEQLAHYLTHSTSENSQQHQHTHNHNHTHKHGAAADKPLLEDEYLLDNSVNAGAGIYQDMMSQDSKSFASSSSHPVADPEHGHCHGVNDSSAHNHHDHSHGSDDHGHSHVPLNTENQSIITFIALWIALSFHSVVEGIVLGSSDSETIKSILVAILAHKGLESFALGASLINAKVSVKKFIAFCLCFALMTPIGILIGILVETGFEGPVSACLSGFGAGTFFYVSVVEVLLPQFNKQVDTMWKVLALAAGFAGMSVIALWV